MSEDMGMPAEPGKAGLPAGGKAAVTGLAGGLVSGLLGIGGSFLVIPLLAGWVGLSRHKAHASALPVAFTAGVFSAGFYFAAGNLDLGLSLEVMLGSLVGVLLGARLMRHVPGRLLGFLFGLFLLAVAAGYGLHLPAPGAPGAGFFLTPVSLGLFAGFASGLLGVGGGAILVPGGVLLLHVREQMAQGISLLAITPTALLGSWAHRREGNLAGELLPQLVGGAVGGSLLGGYLANRLGGLTLHLLLVLALLYTGIRSLWQNRPRRRP